MAREHSYIAKGHWPFPVDMLRHDGSRAATEVDQAMIDRLSGDHAPDRAAFCDVEIKLVGPFKPNTGRWESFGWEIPSDEMYAAIKALREKARRDDALFADVLAKLTEDERRVVLARIHTAGHI